MEEIAYDPSNYRIMLVDDDPTTLAVVGAALGGEGYDVVEFMDPVEAVSELQKERFDVFIVDYKMQEMDGLTFIRQARQAQPDSVRMMLSAVSDFDVVVAAINHGEVFRFMSKPVNAELLSINTRFACEHLTLLREVVALRDRNAKQGHVITEIKRSYRGIEEVTRLPDGSIAIDDVDF